jgi:PAS domain S-box-containing protein
MKTKDPRIRKITQVIQKIAAGDYLSRIEISDQKDEIDAIASGINMLAEEVKDKIALQAVENKRLAEIIEQLQESRKQQFKSQELFRRVFESSPDSILISTLEGGIVTDVNPGFCELSGYDKEEVIGKSGHALNFWENKTTRDKVVNQLLKKGVCDSLEIKFRRKDGKIRHTLYSAVIIDIDGTSHMLSITKDITEIKEIQEELLNAKERYEDLIRTAPDGIVVLDLEGKIIIINESFPNSGGYSVNEVIGMNFANFPGFQERDLQKYMKVFKRFIRGELVKPVEINWYDKNGRLHISELHVSSLKKDNKIYAIQAIARDITEKVQFIDALKSSEKQYRTSLDSMQEGMHLVNKKLEILFANKALNDLAKSLGLNNDFTGKNIFEAFPFLSHLVRDEYEDVFRTGTVYKKEEFFTIGENKVYTSTRLIPIQEGDKVDRILTIIEDITERKKSEQVRELMYTISDSVTQTKNLSELSQVIRQELGKVFDTTNFYIALYNKNKETLTLPLFVDEKDSFNEIPAKNTLTGYLIRNNRPILMKNEQIEELVKKGEIDDVGTPSKIWLGVPLRIKDETIGALVVQHYENENAYSETDLEFLEFVSNQIGLSIETKKAYDDIKIEKAYFEQLFQNSPETIVLTDIEGNLLKVNSEFEKLFGYTEEEAIGKKIDDLIAPGGFYEEARTITQKVGSGEKVIIETARQDKNKNKIDVSILGTPIEIGGGQVGVYGIYRNITDRLQYESNLKLAKEKAEESDKLKSAFLANMSHEIRTPMNAILGFSELLKGENISKEERDEYISIIRKKGNELLLIINDIIDISKIEAGDVRIVPEYFSVKDFMMEIYQQFSGEKNIMNKEQVQFRLNIDKDQEPIIFSDRSRLKQVFNNLIQNAFKFTYEGFVEIGFEPATDTNIRFFISDTGIGIPEDKQDVIFERFRQVDESISSQYGGTGLGLAISKNLTVLLGGNISVHSKPGHGSTFYLDMPLKSIQAKDFKRKTVTPQTTSPNGMPDLKGSLILVAEDDSSNYLFIESFLKQVNAKVLWARDGLQAVDLFKNHKSIKLVLMDIRMPNMNGIEAAREIRRMNAETPLIALTAYAFTNDREKSLEAGCNEYLPKPVKLDTLIDTLNKYLRINPAKES